MAATVANLPAVLEAQGFIPLPISFIHGQIAGALPGPLRDPFDRILIAQAIHADMVLVSNKESFSAYGVRRLW
jgi:PIN domain nuclease of toxin-antitoxin system